MERRLEGLDGLRGIAALSVLLYHVWWLEPAQLGPNDGYGIAWLDAPLAQLRLGVTLFFVLSGFLLYRPWAGGRTPGLGRYAVARALRILPAYWLAVTVCVVVFEPSLLDDPGALLRNYLLLQIYGETAAVIGPAWSLCVELAFYAALPLIALAVAAVARGNVAVQVAALCVLGSTGLAWKAAALPLALPMFLDQFALGMLLAVAYERGVRVPARWTGAAALGVAVPVFAAADYTPDWAHLEGAWRVVYEPAVALALALVVATVVLPRRRRPARLLSARAVVALGAVSYGVFLWHAPIRNELAPLALLPDEPRYFAVNAAIVVAASLAAAWVSWRLVERPALALKSRARRHGASVAACVPPSP